MFLYLFVYTAIKTLFLCSTPNPPRGLLAFPLVFSVLHRFLFGRSPLKNLYFVYSMVCYMHINFCNKLKTNDLRY